MKAGKTYHLTGPNPSKAREFYELFVDELYKKNQKAIFQWTKPSASIKGPMKAYSGQEAP